MMTLSPAPVLALTVRLASDLIAIVGKYRNRGYVGEMSGNPHIIRMVRALDGAVLTLTYMPE